MADAALEISNILSYLIKQASITEAELARKIKIPRATINRLVSGRTPDPRASTLNAIAEFFNISVDQLLGKKPLFQTNKQFAIATNHQSIPIIDLKNVRNWQEFKPESNQDWIMVDPSISEGKFAIRVKGESMWPQFQESTILIIDPLKEAKNRDFVVAYIKKDEEIIFRQLIIENKYKFLKAINAIFPTISLAEFDEILGIVIQIRKNYS